MAQGRQIALILVLAGALWEAAAGRAPKFFGDDPIWSMPAPIPLNNSPVRQNINEVLDFLSQSRNSALRPAKPASAVNTLGEVPDSDWFTNRHGRHRMSRDELQRGAVISDPPTPPFRITGGKNEGTSIGFRMKDSKGRHYFVKADPFYNPELVTSSDVIVSRFLYAIGYNTPENVIVNLKPSDLLLSKGAKIELPGGRSRGMSSNDVEAIVDQIPHYANGSFRVMASLTIEGNILGPFRYEGTRPDDPNDIVPHEDRRDLRGLNVISAWLNNTDIKASNTLDTVVEVNGSRFIRHYQLDFGSALGSDADGPKNPRFGHEFVLPTPISALTRIVSVGFVPAPWERIRFPKLPAVGNFESQSFDPDQWKSNYPNPALMSRLPDDDYWATKQVIAFTDDDIRAIVETARFTDPRSTEYIATTLAERRNKIGRTYFSKILPLDHFRIENGELLFDDLAVQYGFHAPRVYDVRWSRFDNITQEHRSLSASASARLPHAATQARYGSYFSVVIDAHGDPLKPVTVYIRKERDNYKVVGIDRRW